MSGYHNQFSRSFTINQMLNSILKIASKFGRNSSPASSVKFVPTRMGSDLVFVDQSKDKPSNGYYPGVSLGSGNCWPLYWRPYYVAAYRKHFELPPTKETLETLCAIRYAKDMNDEYFEPSLPLDYLERKYPFESLRSTDEKHVRHLEKAGVGVLSELFYLHYGPLKDHQNPTHRFCSKQIISHDRNCKFSEMAENLTSFCQKLKPI